MYSLKYVFANLRRRQCFFFPFSCLDPKVELCPRSFRSRRVKITTPLLGNAPVHLLFANSILKLLWLQPLLLHSTYIHSCILFHKEHKIHLIPNEVNLSILMLQHIFQTTYSFFLVQKMPMIQSGQVLLRFLLHHDYYS